MTTFLNWKDYKSRTKERIITDLFSYLSPRWWPVNVIGSNIYSLFSAYADQLSSASLESLQTFKDLFIKQVRTDPSSDFSSYKIFDNFGSLFDTNKFFNQDFENFNNTYILQGYRQQLRFVSESYFNGITKRSLDLIEQSYNGIGPLVLNSSNDILGWKLTTISGSVLATGNVDVASHVLLLDKKIHGIGNLYVTSYVPNVNQTYIYTYSKLGENTKLLGIKRYNSGLNFNIFSSGSATTSFKNSVENNNKNIMKVDLIPRYNYLNTFVYWRPKQNNLPTQNNLFSYSSGNFIYNNTFVNSTNETYIDYVNGVSTPFFKWSLTSDIVSLPVYYQDYFWYYDWSILTRNETTYKVFIRSYNYQPIPRTVYFMEYRTPTELSSLLSTINPSGSLVVQGHWLFNSKGRANDITGYNSDLIQSSSSISDFELLLPRPQTKLAWKLTSGSINFGATTYESQNLYNKNFLWESWIYGVDNSFGNNYFIFKRQVTPSGSSPNLNSNGYGFYINNNYFGIKISNGGNLESVEGSISEYLSELPYRPHYFACLNINNNVYINVDDKIIASGTLLYGIPSVSTGSLQIQSNVINIGMDEIILSVGNLSPDDLKLRFYESAPKIYGRELFRPYPYHQFQVQVFASGSSEFELHQFSIKGVSDLNIFGTVSLPLFTINNNNMKGYANVWTEKYIKY